MSFQSTSPSTASSATSQIPTGPLPPTPFASSYHSHYLSQLTSPDVPSTLNLTQLLSHLNCSYLSTPGVAPSLTHLKQHAQSLAVLIKYLTLSSRPNILDNDSDLSSARDGESWDWLNDLNKPYTGPEDEELRRYHDYRLLHF